MITLGETRPYHEPCIVIKDIENEDVRESFIWAVLHLDPSRQYCIDVLDYPLSEVSKDAVTEFVEEWREHAKRLNLPCFVSEDVEEFARVMIDSEATDAQA